MNLNKEYAQMVKEQVKSYPFLHPLYCGIEFRNPTHKKSRWMEEYDYLQSLVQERQWHKFPKLLEPLHDPATAIIVTDAAEKIDWVNRGFSKMTGYSSKEAIGRRPGFLQGKETSLKDLEHIRENISKQKPFEGTLLNYRKNGEPYYCHIHIHPLFNRQLELINFLAIEKEVPSPSPASKHSSGSGNHLW